MPMLLRKLSPGGGPTRTGGLSGEEGSAGGRAGLCWTHTPGPGDAGWAAGALPLLCATMGT